MEKRIPPSALNTHMCMCLAHDGNIVSELRIHFYKRIFCGLGLINIFLFSININNNSQYLLAQKQ